MRMGDLGTQTHLIAHDLQRLVGEECPEGRHAHRCPIAERPHAAKSDLGEQTPVQPLFPTENGISALAIIPTELHSTGETCGENILLNAAPLFQNFHNRQRHLGIVGAGPRSIGKLAP